MMMPWMSLVILLCFISHHAFEFSRNAAEISTHIYKVYYYFISFLFFYVTPEFLPFFAVLISYKGSKIQECYNIAHLLGLALSRLHFTYSSVPLTSKRVTSVDCDVLVNKMATKICY